MKITINLFLKITLILSGFSLFLKLVLGLEKSFGFVYISAIISVLLLEFCFVAMLIMLGIKKFKKEALQEFKTEIILLLSAIGTITLLGITN